MNPLPPQDFAAGATTTLSAVAHGRSGDKGNHANVAVIAYTSAPIQ